MIYIITLIIGIIVGYYINILSARFCSRVEDFDGEFTPFENEYISNIQWRDFIPFAGYFIRNFKGNRLSIPAKYLVIEALNGILYVTIFLVHGTSVMTVLYCLCLSALVLISTIDWKTYEIPVTINYFIFLLGLIRVVTDLKGWYNYIIGFFAVSGFLLLVFFITKGRGIGGGDIKLMAATGLLIGWKLNLTALMIGCVVGSIIHVTIMAIKKGDRVLAFGPYLSMGVIIAMIWGEQLVSWYSNILEAAASY